MHEQNENTSHNWIGGQTKPELISLRRFRNELGVVASTVWRWIKRGWLGKPLNIAGRLYLTREQIAEFRRRAEAGEFAVSIKPGAKGEDTR